MSAPQEYSLDWDKLVKVPLTHNNEERGIGELGHFHPIAYNFLISFPWHNGIVEDYFGGGIDEFAAAFLFEVVSDNPNVDRFIWVIAGNLPAIYMVTDEAPNWVTAFDGYCVLAQDWFEATPEAREREEVFPFQKTICAVSEDELRSIVKRIQTEILEKKELPVEQVINRFSER